MAFFLNEILCNKQASVGHNHWYFQSKEDKQVSMGSF